MASKTEARQPAVKASLAALASQSPSAKPDRGNAFLGNLSSYAPIYAVYGPGTSSDGRVQISFKYQLFGNPGAVGGDNRSEEHTSELQSLMRISYAVFCLKKKKYDKNNKKKPLISILTPDNYI